ncbi:MAG: deoxyribonuclease IV [bacterium]
MGLLGAHVSISGGVENAISRGEALGCRSIQIFSKNQKQWKSPALSDASVDAFRERWNASSIEEVVIHDSYLINLGNPDPRSLKKSRESFLDEMERAERLGVPFLVFHPGSHMKTGETDGIRRIAEGLNIVLDAQPEGGVRLLLETTAGQGDHLGYHFEQLAEIVLLVAQDERVGVCYDMAHAFAAGYDIRTEEAYEKTFDEFNKIVGLNRLNAFHLNDSKSDLGSRIDRHEQIGEGRLGLEPFRFLVNDPRFAHHPMILETPEGEQFYKKNLDLLQSLMV